MDFEVLVAISVIDFPICHIFLSLPTFYDDWRLTEVSRLILVTVLEVYYFL